MCGAGSDCRRRRDAGADHEFADIRRIVDHEGEWFVKLRRSRNQGDAFQVPQFGMIADGVDQQLAQPLAAMLPQDKDIRQIGEKGEIGNHPPREAPRFANFGGSEMSEVVECRCTDPNPF